MMNLTQQSGFSFPMIQSGSRGRVRYTSQDTVALISASILQILLTMPGERFWNPTFGCLLRRVTFDTVSQTTAATAKSIILLAIQQWEPRVTVKAADITIVPSLTKDSNVAIQVKYTVNNPDFTTSKLPTSVTFNL